MFVKTAFYCVDTVIFTTDSLSTWIWTTFIKLTYHKHDTLCMYHFHYVLTTTFLVHVFVAQYCNNWKASFSKKMAFSKYSGRAHTYAHTLQEYVLEFNYVCYIVQVKCLASDCVTIINWLIWPLVNTWVLRQCTIDWCTIDQKVLSNWCSMAL